MNSSWKGLRHWKAGPHTPVKIRIAGLKSNPTRAEPSRDGRVVPTGRYGWREVSPPNATDPLGELRQSGAAILLGKFVIDARLILWNSRNHGMRRTEED